jgi:hypothetical protein
MAVNGTGLAAILAGSVFMYAGIKGKSVLGTVQAVVSGKDPKAAKSANPITAPAEPSGGGVSGGGVSGGPIPEIGCGLGPSLQKMEGWFGKLGSSANQKNVPFGHLSVQVNKRVAADVQQIGQEIQAKTPGYLKTVGGFRTSVGASGGFIPYSMHQFGIAIDINAAENTDLGSGNPGTMALHPEIIAIFAAHNWCWGGDWSEPSRDPMHFQYHGGS